MVSNEEIQRKLEAKKRGVSENEIPLKDDEGLIDFIIVSSNHAPGV